MKPNELMVGDWVLAKPSMLPIKVAAVHRDKVGYHAVTHKLNWVRIGLLVPIPLTAETLESNGFTMHLSHSDIKWLWIEKQKFELAIDEENGNKITTALGLIDIEIKYVHELQHALCLCGIEKDIKQ